MWLTSQPHPRADGLAFLAASPAEGPCAGRSEAEEGVGEPARHASEGGLLFYLSDPWLHGVPSV